MRDKFELCCKVIGLVSFCVGIYVSLSAIPMFFQKEPDLTKFLPQSVVGRLSTSDLAGMKASASYLWQYALKRLAFHGIVPALIGLYLMRSGNVFVRLCYPMTGHRRLQAGREQSEDIEFKAPRQKAAGNTGQSQDTKYAPPGYYQQQ